MSPETFNDSHRTGNLWEGGRNGPGDECEIPWGTQWGTGSHYQNFKSKLLFIWIENKLHFTNIWPTVCHGPQSILKSQAVWVHVSVPTRAARALRNPAVSFVIHCLLEFRDVSQLTYENFLLQYYSRCQNNLPWFY